MGITDREQLSKVESSIATIQIVDLKLHPLSGLDVHAEGEADSMMASCSGRIQGDHGIIGTVDPGM